MVSGQGFIVLGYLGLKVSGFHFFRGLSKFAKGCVSEYTLVYIASSVPSYYIWLLSSIA